MPVVMAGYNVTPVGLTQVSFYVDSSFVARSALPSDVISLGVYPAHANITVTMEADYGSDTYRTTRVYTVQDVSTTMTLPPLPEEAFSSRAVKCLAGRAATTLVVTGGPFEIVTPEGATLAYASTIFSDYTDTTVFIPSLTYTTATRIERLTHDSYGKATFPSAFITMGVIIPRNSALVVRVTNNYVTYPPVTTETLVLCQ